MRVASKAFTESVILGEIVTQLERSSGVEVELRAGLGGSRLVWDALVSGAVDVYPEYTGTLVDEILSGQGGDASLSRALAAHGVGMTEPLGFNNTYALGVRAARARDLGISKVSDLRAHADLRFGFSNEFMSRHDGWPGLQRRYELPQTKIQGLDHALAYRALASGDIDVTDVYTTDPEIARDALVLLQDDRRFFERYDAVLLYRLDIDPAALATLRRLQGRIDARTMRTLNTRAQLDHVPQADVAAGFLRSAFGAVAKREVTGAPRMILARVVEHLELVGASLLVAILLGVPLGILAARRRRAGQVVLAVVGIIQTMPTLALLVFMIPLFGIGAFPAVVALFLYSLLPIVRNTHAGLVGVSGALRESAEALGLPRGAVLRLVELPLASPLILAGIKSAAVINVGTATLGALIGAGGLGQPIFTGVRLDDVGLILQGAIPASLLALAVQGAFEIVERFVVPRGLR
ncbi:MAG TPA: glycine betaine ABC transporter substrate-binding protein [Polyangia bacterium]|nr:glycine betaine ABC transporter substrate-binding protein [Polyangia bacterium]